MIEIQKGDLKKVIEANQKELKNYSRNKRAFSIDFRKQYRQITKRSG